MKRTDEPIVIAALPWESPAEEARLQMKAAAHALHLRAADAHAEGMYFEAQSARIEQLASVLSDPEVTNMRNLFVAEGVISIKAVEGPDVNTHGGDA